MRALTIAIAMTAAVAPAAADRPMCRSGAKFHGARLDLDVKAADIRDVFRLLADVGKVNLVVADSVTGRVTLKLRRVPWDQIACTIAAVHALQITISGTIVVVGPSDRSSAPVGH